MNLQKVIQSSKVMLSKLTRCLFGIFRPSQSSGRGTTINQISDFTVDNSLCPHCGRITSDGGGPTREHIFTEAFGGRQTIVACKHCNDGVGSQIEGKLLGPNTALTFIQQGSGMPHMKMRATNEQGDFTVDFATGEHEARLKVNKSQDGEIVNYNISGTPDEVRQVVEGLLQDNEVSRAQIDELFEAKATRAEPELLNLHVSFDALLARRLIAKSALCALTYLQGDQFILTPLATYLRQVLDSSRHWPKDLAQPKKMDPGLDGSEYSMECEAVFESFENMFEDIDGDLKDKLGKEQVKIILSPRRGASGDWETFVVLSLMGTVLPVGLLAPGRPSEMFAPVMLSEGPEGRPIVRDLASGLFNGY